MVTIFTSSVSFPMASRAVPQETATEHFVHYNVFVYAFSHYTVSEFWKTEKSPHPSFIMAGYVLASSHVSFYWNDCCTAVISALL